MASLSPNELLIVEKCIGRVAGRHAVAAACIYGSKAAGYARPDSDIDLLVVLENYPYAIKYVYLKESGVDVSALVVNRRAFENDVRRASLGEFVAGRLLHTYEPISNGEFFSSNEQAYKKRVIIEELQNIVNSANVLGTEILFPLEYVAFAKIKRRMSLYPSATYSYYRTYTGPNAARNLEFSLAAYRRALEEIIAEDSGLLAVQSGGLLQLSGRRVSVEKGGRIRLKMAKRLQELGSYFVQTYAGRRIMHLAFKEAESKIRRRMRQAVDLPDFMLRPKRAYWELPEGKLIIDSKDWLDELALSLRIGDYTVSKKRLGNVNSRTVLYSLAHSSGEYRIAVKELAKSKAVKWAALSVWTAPVKRFRVDPLFRLGSEYRAIRYLRGLGLATPAIEAVVLDRKIIATRFVKGMTLAEVIKGCVLGADAKLLREAGAQIARVHNAGASFGNIKPKNVIASGNSLYFTDVEQFVFESGGDQAWDLAQFVCWGLKGTRNSAAAATIAREFLQGYAHVAGSANIAKMAKSRRHIESFYPVLAPSVAQAIKKEIRNAAG